MIQATNVSASGSQKPASQHRDLLFLEIFRAQLGFVRRLVRRLGISGPDAEDAVQEVFLVVAQRLEEYQERGMLRLWLVVIARQVAMHVHRARFRNERKLEALREPMQSTDPERVLESRETIAFVSQFIAMQPLRVAVVFYLAEVEGMSAVDIAASLKVNLNTVHSRLRASRNRFDKAYARLGSPPLAR